MKSRARERQNHFSPAIGEFRESMNEQDAWARGAFESCFQYVISDAVDVVDEARTNAGKKTSPAVGYISVSLRCGAYHSCKADRHGRNYFYELTPRRCFPPVDSRCLYYSMMPVQPLTKTFIADPF